MLHIWYLFDCIYKWYFFVNVAFLKGGKHKWEMNFPKNLIITKSKAKQVFSLSLLRSSICLVEGVGMLPPPPHSLHPPIDQHFFLYHNIDTRNSIFFNISIGLLKLNSKCHPCNGLFYPHFDIQIPTFFLKGIFNINLLTFLY